MSKLSNYFSLEKKEETQCELCNAWEDIMTNFKGLKFCSKCLEIVSTPIEKLRLVRCPYCRGYGEPPCYYYNSGVEAVCSVCRDLQVITLEQKMRYVRKFKKMSEIERRIFFSDKPDNDGNESIRSLRYGLILKLERLKKRFMGK